MRLWNSFSGLAAVVVVSSLALHACSSSDTAATSSGSDGSGAGVGAVGSGGSITVGSGGSGTGGEEECAETSSKAEEGLAPADIIIAVDTSGSMDAEAQWTQQSMNAMVTTIINSGIDAHVIMISNAEICVPAPLGSGSCPADENLPNYRHVDQSVGSSDALEKILTTYDQYKDSLRPGALKTIVVVSDDDSNLSASAFKSQLLALDPSFKDFKFDAIVSFEDPFSCASSCFANSCQNCGDCCPGCMPLSAAEGTVYKDLVSMTGGVQGDLCAQDFAPVFQDMATSVVQDASIDCVYDIPDPGPGEQIDIGKVNVDYKSGPNANPQTILHVPGGLADCGSQGGWYYDHPATPTKIFLCPATCAAVQGNTGGEVVVKFGCATLVADPK
jgi:hypothetical protein